MANKEDSALVVRDEKSLRIVIGEHCYSLSQDEIATHDEFVREHSAFNDLAKIYGTYHLDERCKLEYFERPAGFSNWCVLQIRCLTCGDEAVLCSDEF